MVLHANNLGIPARFSFRPRVAEWHAALAELVDWAEESSGSLKPLIAFGTPIEKVQRKTGDKVIIRVTPPVDVGKKLGASLTKEMLYGIHEDSSDFDLEMPRKELPDGLLHPDETPTTAPDIAGREFVVLVSQLPESANGPLQLATRVKEAEIKERNVWAMRNRFFSLEPSVVELKTFLNTWGPWDAERRYPGNGFSFRSLPFALVVPDAIWRQRETYRKAVSGFARSWLRTAKPLTFSTLNEWPHFLVERFTCQDALEATITIEHMRKAKYGFCKRCRGMFERDTLHKKNYCSRKCIQADATARWRANQKKESKGKGTKKNAKG
jgi:hypothetical protein